MRRRVLLALAVIAAVAVVVAFVLGGRQPDVQAAGQTIVVPSGQPIEFQDSVFGQSGPAGLTIRFRFVAPEIARGNGTADYDTVEKDMAFLCENYALPRVSKIGPQPSQVVISLSDRPVEFGTANPEATQFFEAYRPEGDTCEWERF